MSREIDIRIPDLGDFSEVPVIEIFVAPGDKVGADDAVIALESDKATLEVPAGDAGVIKKIHVKVGDKVSSGDLFLTIAPDAAAEQTPPQPATAVKQDGDKHAQLVVLGGGPGGYTAAFRAADLGLKVILVERHAALGGVCLNVGCIPSKALLHVAKIISDARAAENIGVTFLDAKINLPTTREWKTGVVNKLTQGLAALAKKRKVEVVRGVGEFTSKNMLQVTTDAGRVNISFDQAVIAAGSRPIQIPNFPHDDARVMDSTAALDLADIPKKLLIVGGGIIGLEMAAVYHALGANISIVEMAPELMPGADVDLVRPLKNKIRKMYQNIWCDTKVTAMQVAGDAVTVSFEGKDAPDSMAFDKVLVAVGRAPNAKSIGAEHAGVQIGDDGFIQVDSQQRTSAPHIFAVGDIVGQPMLAHKAVHEGKVAAEVAAGLKSGFDARVIASVAYTDPEVAWVGVTETEAKARGLDYGKGAFPWAASGRALSQDAPEGATKLLFDKKTNRIIGAGICGHNAGDLIAEAALAIEMNADASDIGLTIHPHPTLSETIGFAAEMFEGTITDLYAPKRG